MISEVVISGIGVVLPNCESRETLWRHLSLGESQLVFEDDPSLAGARLAVGRISSFDPSRYLREFPPRFYEQYGREIQLYLSSVILARDDAHLDLMQVPPTRIGMYSGCARPTFSHWYELFRRDPSAQSFTRRDLMFGVPGQAVGVSASLLEVRGPAYTFTGTCSSAGIALGHAYRDVCSGEVDVAFASGHESSLVPPLFACYRDANLLSKEAEDPRRAITPYVGYSTNAFGEGAITFVLENRDRAKARGASPLAIVAGYGYGNNGYHPTTVDVAGVRPAEVLRDLIERGGVSIDDVGFVVGHGNAVQLSDVSEENYMRQLFRERSAEVPLISTKPIYGHLLGASSALNAAAAALMLHHDFVIPTINIDESRSKRGTFHQPNRGVARPLSHGVTMSYGLGGHNAALLLKKAPK